ncbi:HesB/IscA family protein [Propionivibrio dicarboxylicus]|uniref:Iron-sulfur cluster assembly protein n=1 Tax=Propionivibrio dicarboxylicus TaxID=83767 RepID=A0A1G8EZ81_9RHOO|nr:iron-sulfur cluster assembly accessory protein [Propionivibrio dicarboxylicus]SDH75205.1 iron-sulfur cluster assembly protein [Propionivibrio dicarboxylicus]
MAMRLTDRAAEQIRNYLAERGGGVGIRVIVQSSECSGMAYRLEFVDKAEENDFVFDSCGAKIFVDEKSLIWLEGTEIDYLQIGDESGFAFNNPNARNQCGCGESFYV